MPKTYYHLNYAHLAERIIGDLVAAGHKKFILYPFGLHGKLAKGILNIYHNIQEYAIVDNFLSKKYSNIKSLNDLTENDIKGATLLVTSNSEHIVGGGGILSLEKLFIKKFPAKIV